MKEKIINRSIIFILCFLCLNLTFLFSSTQFIIVTEYEENNYCHSITFKNILKKLEKKDNSNFFIVLKHIDAFDLNYLKKEYQNLNFILDNDNFKLGEFYLIDNNDTVKINIPLNCDERFLPTIIDSVIEKFNYNSELIKINEKIPIFQLPIFPEESISISDSLLLFIDKRNTIHEINYNSGELLFEYEINDSLSDEFINLTDENYEFLNFYFNSGTKLHPIKCIYINKTKYLIYLTTYDVEYEYTSNDTLVYPLQKIIKSKFNNLDIIENSFIHNFPTNSSNLNFDVISDTLINIGFINGLEILYLDSNYSLLESKLIDSTYKFANYLSAFEIENGILLYFNNSILSYNLTTQKTNKFKLDSVILKNINPIKPFMYKNNLSFFYITKDYKEYGIFDYKNEKIITKLNNYFNEEIKDIKLFKQENNILYFLVKLEKSRWHIFKLYL